MLIRKYEYIGYHCTRLDDVTLIKKYGLLKANSKIIKRLQLKKLTEICDGYEETEIEKWIETYESTNMSNAVERGETIDFNLFVTSIKNNSSCNEYFQNIGGEILRDIIRKNLSEDEYKNISSKLSLSGRPYIVKFKVDYKTVTQNDARPFLEELYNCYKNKENIEMQRHSYNQSIVKKEISMLQ